MNAMTMSKEMLVGSILELSFIIIKSYNFSQSKEKIPPHKLANPNNFPKTMDGKLF